MLKQLLKQVRLRKKAVVAALGMLLMVLQALNVVVPQNKYVSMAIGILTVVGVHQASNQE